MPVELAVDNDMPEELKKELSKAYLKGTGNIDDFYDKLAMLFTEKAKLTIDEIIVGWYQQHDKEILKRTHVANRLGKLVKDGRIIRESHATYALPSTDETGA